MELSFPPPSLPTAATPEVDLGTAPGATRRIGCDPAASVTVDDDEGVLVSMTSTLADAAPVAASGVLPGPGGPIANDTGPGNGWLPPEETDEEAPADAEDVVVEDDGEVVADVVAVDVDAEGTVTIPGAVGLPAAAQHHACT